MERLVFNDNVFLKKKDICFGHVYLFKDGRLGVYLGTSVDEQFVFYILAKALLQSTENWRVLTIAHYDIQVKYLVSIVEQLMHTKCDADCIRKLKGLPDLYCDFGYVSYDKDNELFKWYTKNKMLNEKLPQLSAFMNKEEKKKSIFVSAKDLVPGELYYTGSLWRSLYMYLGRDSNGYFCWYFVGNKDILIQNNLFEYQRNIDRTKSNKRCKRLADAVNDSGAYLYDDAKKLIDMHWKGNLIGLRLD